MPASRTILCRSLASWGCLLDRLATGVRNGRTLSTSTSTLAYRPTPKRIRTGNPKRDPTTYGIPDKRRSAPEGWEESPEAAAHPLWQFFHGKQAGPVPDRHIHDSGRAWLMQELRRKSFEHLHQLWYILLKERNVLLTQRHEWKRLQVATERMFLSERLAKVKKSMARIKATLSERRIAVKEAVQVLHTRRLQASYPGLAADDPEVIAILKGAERRRLPEESERQVANSELFEINAEQALGDTFDSKNSLKGSTPLVTRSRRDREIPTLKALRARASVRIKANKIKANKAALARAHAGGRGQSRAPGLMRATNVARTSRPNA